MKKIVLSVVAALALAAPAFAADMPTKAAKAPAPAPAPSMFDLAFGSALMTDYNFRGITQSAKHPSVAAYFEPRLNLGPNFQLFAGVAGESINFPNNAAAEIDIYGGIRPTFGPFTFDLGVWYYWYPGGSLIAWANGNISLANMSMYEIYFKPTWNINDSFAVGGNLWYSPSWMNTGATSTYASLTAKFTGPAAANGWGWYVSGELGRLWLGTAKFNAVIGYDGVTKFPDYTTWNLGIGATYKVLTFDLRYYDTDLTKSNCNILTGDQGATFGGGVVSPLNPLANQSKWCGSALIAKVSADLTLGSLK